MKILHTVESYYPETGGMAEVVRQLSERLTRMGHQVTVATRKRKERISAMLNGVLISEFNVDGNLVRGMSGETEIYKNFILNTDADVITNFAAQQWATDIALPVLDKLKAKKVFVPTGFSEFYNPQYKSYFENLKIWMKGYDANIFLSDDYRDINFARDNGITHNILIPNGAAADEFLPLPAIDIRNKLGIDSGEFLIYHLGSYTGGKGHKEAVEIFLKSSLRNSVLLLIGFHNDHFQKEIRSDVKIKYWELKNLGKNKRIIISSVFNRQETVAAYQAADLFLFPSNIECSPIVLFECMASKTPFLTTDVGNAKEIIKWSNGGMLLPTTFDDRGYSHAVINKSVQLLNRLYLDNEKRRHLAENGFNAWKNNFTWELIASQYDKLYNNLLKSTL